MASFERNPGKPVRATFYLLVTIENPVRTRSHRQQIEPLDIQSYLPPGTFRMVILPMPAGFSEKATLTRLAWTIWRPLGESNPCCQDENLES